MAFQGNRGVGNRAYTGKGLIVSQSGVANSGHTLPMEETGPNHAPGSRYRRF